MMKIRKGVTWLAKACIAGILALGIVSVISVGYMYTGAHVQNPSGATDYVWEANQYTINNSEGFAIVHYDENGFNNSRAIEKRPIDILLTGDSHMQGDNVLQTETVCYLLNTLSPSQYTYSIATSDHSIYTWVKNMENALREFPPTSYVIMETGTVALDVEKMQAVIEGRYEAIPSYDHGLLYQIQKWVPAIKRTYKNMDDWMILDAATENTEIKDVDYSSDVYANLLNEFLGKAASAAEDRGIELVMFYMPATSLDAGGGQLIFDTDPEALRAFQRACENGNIIFIDMSEDFRLLYEREHRLPYGFINTRVGKGHINSAGHRVIAERLSRELSLTA